MHTQILFGAEPEYCTWSRGEGFGKRAKKKKTHEFE